MILNVYAHSTKTQRRWIEKIYATTDGTILIGTMNHGLKIFNIKDSTYRDIIAYNTDKTEIFVRDFLQSAPENTGSQRNPAYSYIMINR
jgi:hypothetical protein